MNYRGNKRILLLVSLVLVIMLLAQACRVEPIAPIQVQNNTDQDLSIYVKFKDNTYYVGEFAPGAEIKNKNTDILLFSRFLIEAKNAEGEVIYSQKFYFEEIADKDWKVVIPPLKD